MTTVGGGAGSAAGLDSSESPYTGGSGATFSTIISGLAAPQAVINVRTTASSSPIITINFFIISLLIIFITWFVYIITLKY